jgi:hypothetical protein
MLNMRIPLAGYLSEYSLAEIFNFIQVKERTGVLCIKPMYKSANHSINTEELAPETLCYFVSCQSGRIVSIFHGLTDENEDLLTTIADRQWIPPEQVRELRKSLNGLILPWGLQLKILNVISADRVKLLFNRQVIANISKIFAIEQGKFNFDPQSELNYSRMTGLSLYPRDAILLGLRKLKEELMMEVTNLAVTGAAIVGKSTFILSVSEIEVRDCRGRFMLMIKTCN